MRKRRRLTSHEKLLRAISYLTLSSGWELIPYWKYYYYTPEEMRKKEKEIRAAVEKALEDL